MDKKSIIGLVLIGIILFGFSWYNGKQQQEFQRQQFVRDSTQAAQKAEEIARRMSDTTYRAAVAASSEQDRRHAQAESIGGMLSAALDAPRQTFTVSNEVMDVEFSTLGGKVSDVTLKDYERYYGGPLRMFKPESQNFDVSFYIKRSFNDAQLNTGSYNFVCDAPSGEWSEGEQSKNVSMRLYVDSTAYVEYLYTVYRDSYMMDFDIRFVGMASMLSNQSDFEIAWSSIGQQNEKGFDNENNYSTISYKFPDTKSIENLGMSKAGQSKSEDVEAKVQWVAFKQQYFSSVMIADGNFQNAAMKYDTYKPGEGKIKKYSARLSVPFSAGETSYKFKFYYGPNKYSILKKFDLSLERLIPLGGSLVGWVNRWFVIPMFDFLSKYIASFGWIILIMTVVIKVIISPLTYKSYLSSAKMRVIKPEMDEINAKYPKQEDAMKKQQAIMELYKRAGINPMSGCIPMLIQFPILIAMFRFFPASIELRGEKLLWADDLSSYDTILNLPFSIPWYGDHVSGFALLMAGAMFVYSWINFKQNASSQPQMAGMKFMMLYMMPIMMLLWFNNYASGLCYYYFLSNLITIAQMFAIRYMVDDKKLHRQMMENAKKPRKKSKFQQRYEAAMRQQQEMIRQQQKARR